MRVLSRAVFALLVSPTVFAGTITPTALAPATMDELARVVVPFIHAERAERGEWARPSIAALENAVAATVVIAPQATTPPPVTRGFQASTELRPDSTEGYSPADASGAVGPQHVVGAFNNELTVHDRAGRLLSRISENQFWHDSSLPDKYILYDPRVAYDAASDRWVFIVLGDDYRYKNGVLYVGVSTSGNPAGGWRRFRMSVDPTGQLDADISKLAFTADKIVITVNVWTVTDKVNTDVFTIPKSAAFAGPDLPLTTTVLPPKSDLLPLGSDDTTVRLVEWMDDTYVRTFELLPSGAIANSSQWIANVFFGPPAPCAQLDYKQAPQCSGILLSGIARNGTMWIVQETFLSAPLVWKIRGDAATAYVIQDKTRALGFPSIAVNRRGAALVGYVLMSASIHISAGYSYIDPAGNISAPAVLKSGEAPYYRDRWGDFTTTLVDPLDDLSFWTLGIYADSLLNSNNRWATWWGHIPIADTIPPRQRAVRH